MGAIVALLGVGPAITNGPHDPPEDLTIPLVAAVQADNIVKVQGLCIHQGPPYADSLVVSLMQQCKVRFARTGDYQTNDSGPFASQRNALGAIGVKFMNQFTGDDNSLQSKIDDLAANHPEYQAAVANRNEPNYTPVKNDTPTPAAWPQTPQPTDGSAGKCSAARIREDLRNLWENTRASSNTYVQNVMVSGGVFASYQKAGWYASLGYLGPKRTSDPSDWRQGCNSADNHDYWGGDPPLADPIEQSYVKSGGEHEDLTGPGLPASLSECGYHNAVGETADIDTWTYTQKYYSGTHKATPASVAGTYIARLPWIFFGLAGNPLSRYYLFQLMDEPDARNDRETKFYHERNFGQVLGDGTPKPAFKAIVCTNALLNDPGGSFTPAGLRIKVTQPDGTAVPNSVNLNVTVTEKRDGSWVVCLFRDVSILDNSVYRSAVIKNDANGFFIPDPTTQLPQYSVDPNRNPRDGSPSGKPIPGKKLTVDPVSIKVTLSKARTVAVYKPVTGSDPITPATSLTTITLPLDADVQLLKITAITLPASNLMDGTE